MQRKCTQQYKNILFNELAVECNTVDVNTVRDIYNGLVRVVEKRLKRELFVELPGLIQISIFKHKGRRYRDVNTMQEKFLEPHRALRVKANQMLRKKIREYFKYED